jgi:hypothetical protein
MTGKPGSPHSMIRIGCCRAVRRYAISSSSAARSCGLVIIASCPVASSR